MYDNDDCEFLFLEVLHIRSIKKINFEFLLYCFLFIRCHNTFLLVLFFENIRNCFLWV